MEHFLFFHPFLLTFLSRHPALLPPFKVRMVLSVYQRWWDSGDSFVLDDGENLKQPQSQQQNATPHSSISSSLHPSSRSPINRSLCLTTLLIRCTNNIFHLLIMRESLPGIWLQTCCWSQISSLHLKAPSSPSFTPSNRHAEWMRKLLEYTTKSLVFTQFSLLWTTKCSFSHICQQKSV